MNNYSFSIKKNYRWLMIICSLITSNFTHASHEPSAEDKKVEEERQRIDNDLKNAQKEQEDALKKYNDDKARIDVMRQKAEEDINKDLDLGKISKETAYSNKQSLDNNNKVDINKLNRDFFTQQDELSNLINTLQKRKESLSPDQLTADKANNEEAQIEKAQNDMKKIIDKIGVNFNVFAPALKENQLNDDQYLPVIVMAAEFKRSINNVFYLGRVTDEQANQIENLKMQCDAIIKQAYLKIIVRFDEIIKNNTVKSSDSDTSIKTVQDAINRLYGLEVSPSLSPTDEEIQLIKEGKDLLEKFNEKIKNITNTSLDYYRALLEFKKGLIELLHGHLLENISDLVQKLNTQNNSEIVQSMIDELKKDNNDVQELVKQYQLDVDLGIKFITKEVQVILDQVDESVQKEFYNEEKHKKEASHKIIEDLLYLNKAFDELKSFKDTVEAKADLSEQKKNDIKLIEETIKKVKEKIKLLNEKRVTNNDYESGIVIHDIDPVRSVKITVKEVFSAVTERLEVFFKENNLAIMPSNFKNPESPTIDEQLNYATSFFEALKNNNDQYSQQFQQLLTKSESVDIVTIPNFSKDTDNTSKMFDEKYQEFKINYDNAQKLMKDCIVEIAQAESRNDMISVMQREMEGVQLSMNVSGYFLDLQKSSYFSLFITDGKVDGTKIKDFFKIPVNPTDVQLKALGKQVLGLVGSKQIDIFTDEQKINAGEIVYDALKNKTDILHLSLDEMICLAQMYEDQYKNNSGTVNLQANAARQTVYLLRTAGQLGWQEMQALINGQQDYGQIKQGETLTNQLKNIKEFRTNLLGLPLQTTGLIDEMNDQVNNIQLWLNLVNHFVIGQDFTQENLNNQSVTLSTSQIDDEINIYDIGFAGSL